MQNLPLEVVTDENAYKALCRDLRIRDIYSRHILRECRTCGWLEWSSSSVGDKVIEIWSSERDCDQCRVVQMRNPEVYAWVIGVMIKTERDARRQEEADRKT